MSFEKDWKTFLTGINSSLEQELDKAFVELMKKQAEKAFAGAYQKKAKRPLNCYQLFMKEYTEQHKGEDNLMKNCSAAWAEKSDAEKQPYVDRAKELKEEAKNAPDDQAEPAAEKPKRKTGPTGYLLYLKELRKDGTKISQKEGGEKWKSLGEEGQKEWKDKAAEMKAAEADPAPAPEAAA